MNKTQHFNGGKIEQIFENDPETNTYNGNFTNDDARDAFLYGKYFVKVDGSNGMLVRQSFLEGLQTLKYTLKYRWVLFQRYDDKKGKLDPDNLPKNIISLPIGGNPSVYNNHRYYYKLMAPSNIPDESLRPKKKQKLINDSLYSEIEHSKHVLENMNQKFISVELIGKKFQKTPGVNVDCEIALHQQQTIDIPEEYRTFEGMKHFLLDEFLGEGLIVSHNGKYWKIRANCFDKNCNFEKWKKGKDVDTTLAPHIVTLQDQADYYADN